MSRSTQRLLALDSHVSHVVFIRKPVPLLLFAEVENEWLGRAWLLEAARIVDHRATSSIDHLGLDELLDLRREPIVLFENAFKVRWLRRHVGHRVLGALAPLLSVENLNLAVGAGFVATALAFRAHRVLS